MQKKHPVSLRLPPDLRDALEKRANERHRPLSEIAIEAMRSGLGMGPPVHSTLEQRVQSLEAAVSALQERLGEPPDQAPA